MGSYTPTPFDVKKVAIIGAGPCGLAVAKYLGARKSFESITIFEQQDRIGGIWYYSQEPPSELDVPQTSPFVGHEQPLPPKKQGEAPVFPSPMYETLHANIPGSLMNYKDVPFPKDAWVYPSRQTILEYVDKYADEVRHLIRLNTQVQDIQLRQVNGVDKWDLQASSTISDDTFADTYDAVVVANGHYSTPFIPDVKGIQEFNSAHPNIITHSKNYRRPEPYKGKKVVVVGNGPSGLDLARQISNGGAQVLLSVHQPTAPEKLQHVGASELGEITEFLPSTRAIRLIDGSVEENVDAVIYCTGFLFTYPFLPSLAPKLLTTGQGVHGLYKHLFLTAHTTLAFPGLLMKAVPFPVSEAQGAALAAVWANSLALPPVEEMQAWTRKLREERGEALHTFPSHGGDGYYINELYDWVTKEASEPGREPPRWGDEMMWQRSIFAAAKTVFEKKGATAKTLEELGFEYPGPAEDKPWV